MQVKNLIKEMSDDEINKVITICKIELTYRKKINEKTVEVNIDERNNEEHS